MSTSKKLPNIKIDPIFFCCNHTLKKILFIGVLLAVLWAIYFSIFTIFIPYQIEFREGAALVTTKIVLGGGNPYTFENQPLGLNVYGVGYSLVVSPFAFLFGNTLLTHRAITFIFIILSALVNAASAYKTRKDISLAFGCAAFTMTGLIGHGGAGAFPAAMGSFLFLASILTPFNRSFDKTSLFISSLTAVFAFYTKPYFVLAFALVSTYLFLFVSKKKFVFYGLIFLPLFAAFFIAARVAFPLYFTNIIIANVFLTVKSAETLVGNLRSLLIYFYPALILAVIVLVKGLFVKKDLYIDRIDQKIFDLINYDRPFVTYSFNYVLYLFVCSFLVFLLVLGPHGGGTGMNYAYQLLTPLFFCWLFQKIDLNDKMRFIAVALLLFNLFAWQQKILKPDMLKQKESKEWAQLFKHVESSSNILNSQITASKVVEVGLNPIDSGQTIIFYEIQPFPENILLGPPYENLYIDGFKYVTFIDKAIENQRFDIIITTKEKASFFHIKRLFNYYSVVAEIKVDMPQTNQTWTALVWKPLVK